MKILVVGIKNWHGKWTDYTVSAFQNLGHEVVTFYYNDYTNLILTSVLDRFKTNRRFLSFHYHATFKKTRLIAKAKSKKYDFILILKGEELDEETFFELKKTKVPLAIWCVDSPFGNYRIENAYYLFDFFFVFDTFYKKNLEDLKVKNIYHLPCSFSEESYFPELPNKRFESDVSFVGSYFPPREKLILRLHPEQYKVKLWGPSWFKNKEVQTFLNQNPSVFQDEFLENKYSADLYRSSKILLNLNHSQTKYNGMNQRMLEIPACKGFQLCDYREGFEEFFEDGRDIVYFKTYEEIPELVDKFLKDESTRSKIAENGYNRVKQEHSYKNRMQKIIEKVTK